MNNHEIDMSVVSPSDIGGSELIIRQNVSVKQTNTLPKNLASPADESFIGVGLGTFQPSEPDYAGAFRAVGPAAIKLGQSLATRPDLVGDEAAQNLLSLQDNLPDPAVFIVLADIEGAEQGLQRCVDIGYGNTEGLGLGAVDICFQLA